jgi:AbrB family transcriptional regulator (stage V sporulation protein T)
MHNSPVFPHTTHTNIYGKVCGIQEVFLFMKATGIVRRIDDLGRVVIPKEIRRTLRIREGDPLEIFTDREGEIILKKYSPIGELGSFAKQYADVLAQGTGQIVCITDRDQVIAFAGGPKKDVLQKPISRQLEEIIDGRESFIANRDERRFIPIIDGDNEDYSSQVISPIICEGDAIGSVIITTKEQKVKFTDADRKLTGCAAGFLGKQMES